MSTKATLKFTRSAYKRKNPKKAHIAKLRRAEHHKGTSLQLPLPGLSSWRVGKARGHEGPSSFRQEPPSGIGGAEEEEKALPQFGHKELLSLPELAQFTPKRQGGAASGRGSTVVSSSAARFSRRKMRLLMEVVPATRRSSWLFPILPFIWGFVIASSLVNAGPTYLLAVPKIIRPGANLTIGVRLLKESPSSIRIQAQVLLANKSILQGEAVFQRDSFSTLVLPSLPLGSTNAYYELLVNGYSKEQLLFSNHISLPFASKSFSVFIQTDKAMYKPGQEVKIRVVTLHSDLKPYNTPVNIYIQDPQRNLIQQWLTQNGKLGKIAKRFKLSKHPLLGDWSIEVQVNGQAYYQSFAVMEYVAPKFEVYLTTPTYYSMQSMLNGTITAKYVYGKPMKGKVTIDFFSLFRRQNTKITKIMEINGSLNFTLESSEIKYVTVEDEDVLHPAPIEIIAVVTESLTGISQNASATVFPQLHDYALDFVEYPRFLKPSLNFIAMLKVRRTDNHPLTSVEQKNNVTITVTQSKISYQLYENELQKKNTDYELNYPVPENGIIQIDIPVSANTTVLYIKAEFLESQTFIKIHDVFYSPSLSYLQIRKTSKDLKVIASISN